mmetsp:Transcript_5937/g.10139  ORF Transcript_5937/g.10139 Transcript_5937/m.10139 type:complete len:99 (+) Transcript_5937:734-1030(+)
MGASFRNTGEITELCGVDYLTISPSLLQELKDSNEKLEVKLNKEDAKKDDSIQKISLDEKGFRWDLCNDACATLKLAEGIRNFSKDINSLEESIKKEL